MTDAQIAEGWTAHDGGPCPVPLDTWVYVAFRDGVAIRTAVPAKTWTHNIDQWRHMNRAGDIIAYRLIPS